MDEKRKYVVYLEVNDKSPSATNEACEAFKALLEPFFDGEKFVVLPKRNNVPQVDVFCV